jgi:hypothetical protein
MRVACHPFLHRTENPRAAGAKQNNDGDIVLNKRLVIAVLRFARRNQVLRFTYRAVDAFFQIAKLANQRRAGSRAPSPAGWRI